MAIFFEKIFLYTLLSAINCYAIDWPQCSIGMGSVHLSGPYLSQWPLTGRVIPESVVMDVGQVGILRQVQRYEFLERCKRTVPDVGKFEHAANDQLLKLIQADERLVVQVIDGIRVDVEERQRHITDFFGHRLELVAVQEQRLDVGKTRKHALGEFR